MAERENKYICPLCYNSSFKSIYLYHVAFGKKFEKLVCKNCSLVQVSPMLTEEEIHMLYSTEYFQKDYRCEAPKCYQEAIEDVQDDFRQRILPLIQYYSGISKGLRALEIGCAGGANVQVLQEAGYEAYGVELNPEIAEWGKIYLDVNIMAGTLEKHSFPNNFFNVIYMGDVLEHIPKPIEFLSEVWRVGSDEAILIVDIPFELNSILPRLFHSIPATLLYIIWRYERKSQFPPYHVFVYNPRTIRLLMKKTRFNVKMIRQTKILRLLSWKAIFDIPNYLLTKVLNTFGDRATIVAKKIKAKEMSDHAYSS